MEMAGAKEQMITFYQQAGELGHRFYLPYLKVAKTAQMDLVLDVAEENYLEGIQCLKEGAQSAQTRMILGSAYANLSATLTMMHRLEDAVDAMEISRQYAGHLPGRSGTVAITAAAEGDFARAEEAMAELGKEAPQMLDQVTDVVEKIRTGTHSHFFTRPIPEEDISAFWNWFSAQEAVLFQMVRKEDPAGAVAMLQERLAPLFAFSEKGIELAVAGADDGIEVSLADFYSLGLRGGYEQLLKACPGEVRERWKFEIVR
jgi:hypothetical protein